MIEIPIGVSPLRAEVALKSTFDVPLAVAETLVKSPFQDWWNRVIEEESNFSCYYKCKDIYIYMYVYSVCIGFS